MAMTTIHRCMLRELLVDFALALVALNFVLAAENMVRVTKSLSYVGLTPSDMARFILYMQPLPLMLAVPLAMLISVLLAYGRMNADSELVAMRASGMAFVSIARPVFILGGLSFALALAASFYLAPLGARALREESSRLISERAAFAVEEGIFNSMLKGVVIFASEKPKDDVLKGVFIQDERNPDRPAALFADHALIGGAEGRRMVLDLRSGHIVFTSREGRTTELAFDRYRFTMPMDMKPGTKKEEEMGPLELLREARGLDGSDRTDMLMEFYRRITFPALCLVLMVMGPPLAMRSGKAGKTSGLAMGFLVFAVYYGLLVYFESLVRSGILPPAIGAWAPAIIMGSVAWRLFRREASL